MQDVPTHTPSDFDLDKWREELLALNPWARGLTIDEGNEEFTAARQKATRARHAEGKEVWNAWANSMLEKRAALETADLWNETSDGLGRVTGDNEATKTWLALALASFVQRRFEADTSFDRFLFPGDAAFIETTFSDGGFNACLSA
jgi:hypothetical protein